MGSDALLNWGAKLLVFRVEITEPVVKAGSNPMCYFIRIVFTVTSAKV